MKSFLVIISVLFSTCVSMAKPVYFNILMSQIEGAKLTNKCLTCHSGGPQLNPFGRQFGQAKNKLGSTWSKDFWVQIKDLDADQDGLTNEDEILNGLNPGKAEPKEDDESPK